ncbi:hypothetical protein NUU61_006382 [Penicillium alfredii]|uniref:BZIP transcription factor n=1 Tax=Penicillium alfredii TaxID=1506179 RepID=A0A9W9F0U0_9EURO|nr:uncharacterized protein NUU61_006382 [Penicillium alfredii]KAJ5091512.1 hypothetical protein NUU61_006382 [Penicillium alfredii]
MANRASPNSQDAAPPPAIATLAEGRSHPDKLDDSTLPQRATSLGPEHMITDLISATTSAGRKRKLNSTSARGVANLTPDQLAKKRANDRQAQRAIRERNKGHIEALEQQVRDLSSQKPFLDLQAALRQNENTRSENRELRQGLKAAMDIIQPLLAKSETSDAPASLPQQQPRSIPPPSHTSPPPDAEAFTSNSHGSIQNEKQYPESIASIDTPSPTHSAPALRNRRSSSNGGYQPSPFRHALDTQRYNITHGLDFGAEERLGFNFLLEPSQNVPKIDRLRRSSSEHLRSSHTNPPSPLCPHPLNSPEHGTPAFAAPIKNIAPTCTLDIILVDFLHTRQREAAQGIPRQKLVGPPYPSVSSLLNPEKSVDSHPVSKVFTDILRTFPDISSLPEQVAVLYVMFLLMRWQIYPTQENYDRLPDWLTPRPTQLLQPHPAWMDYIPFPRMRDRVVTSYQDYPFENWFIPFTRDICVNWPYEGTDCLLSAGDSDELVINPVFERHMRNLSNWSLGTLFAESYPALADTARIKTEATTQTSTPRAI